MNLNHTIIIPKFKPVNREQQRLLMGEYARIMSKVNVADTDFLIDLLTLDLPYKEIYAKHLELYTKEMVRINALVKPTCFDVNWHYFEQMYKPLEDEL